MEMSQFGTRKIEYCNFRGFELNEALELKKKKNSIATRYI